MKRLLLSTLVVFAALASFAQSSPLAGLRMGVIGDSYVKNHRDPVENTWHYKFAARHGISYYNYGRNGNCVSLDLERWGPSLVNRYKDMADSLDIVVVIAGHNDAARIDSVLTIEEYKAKCGELCRGLIERYPAAQIFWFTPWANPGPGFEKVVEATKEVAGGMGIAVLDAYHNANIYALSDKFRAIYFQGKGVRDHAHLNAKGHDRFLPVAEKFILQYLPAE